MMEAVYRVRVRYPNPYGGFDAVVYRNGRVLASYGDPVEFRARQYAAERITTERARDRGEHVARCICDECYW